MSIHTKAIDRTSHGRWNRSLIIGLLCLNVIQCLYLLNHYMGTSSTVQRITASTILNQTLNYATTLPKQPQCDKSPIKIDETLAVSWGCRILQKACLDSVRAWVYYTI